MSLFYCSKLKRTDMSSDDSLDVIVVGAGIAGLSAAIALRRAGHRVVIYERSGLDNEVGAAIHVCPNASRILDSWGYDFVGSQLVVAKRFSIADSKTLKCSYQREYSDIKPTYGHEWYYAHRVDLHNELKRLATAEGGLGKSVDIESRSTVVGYDPRAGSITLADGNSVVGDVIVAADGVHSLATEVVHRSPNPAVATNQTAYRFLIPSSAIEADPKTAHFLQNGQDDGCMKIYAAEAGRRLVWYPCRDNEEHNFVGLFNCDAEGSADDYVAVETEELLKTYSDFHPSILEVLKKATAIKQWPLLFRPPLPRWHDAKLVLIGDAAHPMLPHQGQAGAQAIEDSAALGTIFSDLTKTRVNTNPNLLEKRLGMFEDVRKNRTSAMQMFSNQGVDQAAGIERAVKPYFQKGEHVPTNPDEFVVYNFSCDVVKDCLEKLEREV